MKDKSVDLLICTEVIEHLSKKDGLRLISEIKRVCRGRAIISTPNVFFDNPENEDEDVHRSLWQISLFRKHGYKVYGMGFKVALTPNNKYVKIREALHYIFTPLAFVFPEISGFLLCVKDFS